ncbi:hypothetical protein FGG08_005223 [Glutinoglossum americanum]|uniref:Telomerase reverse transcriptase n=1 Tax=Glutinoglossum americanum TaxID=1670608 RepID=A0A9P8I9V6_9PEZI|nr:hypothetical protein FGG08_005223 [Glutinoglossum americanum]
MTGKRKRTRSKKSIKDEPRKKAKTNHSPGRRRLGCESSATISHPLLSLYYPRVATLRDYLISRLPSSSKTRQRRIASLGIVTYGPAIGKEGADADEEGRDITGKALATLLDSTLVGVPIHARSDSTNRLKELETYSQHHSASADHTEGGAHSQSEPSTALARPQEPPRNETVSVFRTKSLTRCKVIDFVIYLLFNGIYRHANRPPHIICQGYQRSSAARLANQDHATGAGIPGLVSHFPNVHVDTLKSPLWASLLRLLGRGGECAMIDLVLDCGIFIAVNTGQGNYYQLSGIPLIDLQAGQKPLEASHSKTGGPTELLGNKAVPEKSSPKPNAFGLHTPGNITFVRNRMLYARAALNSKGEAHFGLRHIHVLNRYSDPGNPEHTVHIMKYIFPRVFGLHNVFDSTTNSRETVQPFKDYTMREQEITSSEYARSLKNGGSVIKGRVSKVHTAIARVPTREFDTDSWGAKDLDAPLAPKEAKSQPKIPSSDGSTMLDTQNLTNRSGRTIPSPDNEETNAGNNELYPQKQSFADFATPPARVSAFCRAVLCTIIPEEFWGTGEIGEWNKNIMMRNVDRFIRLRRFESLTLHEVLQGLKIIGIPWLTPPNLRPTAKISLSDQNKRLSIFSEFVYYVFDSLLIPLIRSNFHVTETNVHRNRLLFFRHNVWRSLSEPALTTLKLSMFEEVKTATAKRLLDKRSLGFSQVRILPKEVGVRPIVNLRRRVMKKHNGRVLLGRSINSVMTPVFNVLGYEKKTQPSKLGSALFSVGDMYLKLKSYKAKLEQRGLADHRLYFAKVDVQSCFDTIPQRQLVQLVERLVTQQEYRIERHVEIRPPDGHGYSAHEVKPGKPSRQFKATARASDDYSAFGQAVEEDLARGKKNTIFVDQVVRTFQDRDTLLDLLGEHVQRNLVKIGKKFYRQKAGIPQGSVLSSLLCNFFYGDLEQKVLGFLGAEDSILLRLIDDFLLITLNRDHAKQFLQVMHDGRPEYGVSVNPAKSLVNFEVVVNDKKVPRLVGTTQFPYCATLVDTRTLDICKERRRAKDGGTTSCLSILGLKLTL